MLSHTSGGSTDHQLIAELRGIKHLLRQMLNNQSKTIGLLSNLASNNQNTIPVSSTPRADPLSGPSASTPRMAAAPLSSDVADQLLPLSDVLEDDKWLNPVYVNFS